MLQGRTKEINVKNKEKSLNKKIAICIALCLLFHIVFWPFVFGIAFKISFGSVDSYITEQVDIYVPDGIAKEFKQYLSIDIDEYWIFCLNKEEQNEIQKDIETNNWRLVNDTDVMIVEDHTTFDDYGDIYESINNHKCYIYIFDCDNKIELPNDNGYFTANDCYEWLFFIYDTETHYYYVVHQSM